MTFLSVSAACHARSERFRSERELNRSTKVAIVGVAGVSCTTAAAKPAKSILAGSPTCTASVLAEYEQLAQLTNVSSPDSHGNKNSSDAEPPIAPDIAETTAYGKPNRSKVRKYAARCAS